jgi:hypothetical protein
MINFINKVKRRLRYHFNQNRFKAFGKNSVLMEPCMVTNPQFIEIGENVFIREYSRI